MKDKTHKQKLIEMFEMSEETDFETFLIKESERNHLKSVMMAGDLGEAFSNQQCEQFQENFNGSSYCKCGHPKEDH